MDPKIAQVQYWIARFQNLLEEFDKENPGPRPVLLNAVRDGLDSQIDDLKKQLRLLQEGEGK